MTAKYFAKLCRQYEALPLLWGMDMHLIPYVFAGLGMLYNLQKTKAC